MSTFYEVRNKNIRHLYNVYRKNYNYSETLQILAGDFSLGIKAIEAVIFPRDKNPEKKRKKGLRKKFDIV